jgi:hypothetical protein
MNTDQTADAGETIPLSRVPRELHSRFGVTASYRQLYQWCVDARVPAELNANGTRWRIREADLPVIADFAAGGRRSRQQHTRAA